MTILTTNKKPAVSTVICYRTTKGDEYLSYYTYKTVEDAQKEVDTLNANKPAKLWNGESIDWTEVECFFVDTQEEMY